jgi:hypothetical protein
MDNPLNLAIVLLLILVAGFLLGYLTHRALKHSGLSFSFLGRRKKDDDPDRARNLAIYRLMSALSATLNYQKVLETALDMSGTVLTGPGDSTDRMVSAVLLFFSRR